MEIKNRICFRLDKAKEMVEYLINNDIPFEVGKISSSLEIFESDPHWPIISEYVTRDQLSCQSEMVFTKQELLEAEWLSVYCQWRFGYPQPENGFNYEKVTYDQNKICSKCGCGLEQVSSFRIKKEPRWGNRHFAELNWIGDELFLDDVAKSVLEKERISGISFQPVLDKKGVAAFPNIFQLRISNILKQGLFPNSSSIREHSTCKICGRTKYVPWNKGILTFKKDIFSQQPDVVKTGEVFGSMQYAVRMILVRQNVYRVIIENKLDRGLVFEPIKLS